MTRPRQTKDNADLMPWSEIAGRLKMPVEEVRRDHDRALRKLRKAMEAQGLDAETVREYLHLLEGRHSDKDRMIQYLNLHYPHQVDPR